MSKVSEMDLIDQLNQSKQMPKKGMRRQIRHISSSKQVSEFKGMLEEDLRRSIPMFSKNTEEKSKIDEEINESCDFLD